MPRPIPRSTGPRLFIAIPLPKTVRLELAKIKERRSHWPVKWIPPDNLHLTLVFLGNQKVKDIDLIKQSLDDIAGYYNIFRIRLSYFEIIPSKKRPKIIWIKCRDNADLQKIFDKLYLSLRSKNPDLVKYCKYYLPHVTLARFKALPHPTFTYTPSLSRTGVQRPVRDLPHPDETYSFVADKITLFKSILGGYHSKYKEIHSVRLKN